ncbi:oxidoreductase, partial [Salmonella enterica subsp. enterica serovar 4,12:i:-]|uniref:SDR family NAD(P)-dependent oxidoreductase n=1 Tax=Salmonella enterica TaxID=28901 RepID=UPI000D67F618
MSEERMINTTIVITGASSGFGRGAALALAKRGANVVLAARRGEALEALAQGIIADNGHALAVETDVSQPDQVAVS